MPFSACPGGPTPQNSSLDSCNKSWRHPYAEMMLTQTASESSDSSVTYHLPHIQDSPAHDWNSHNRTPIHAPHERRHRVPSHGGPPFNPTTSPLHRPPSPLHHIAGPLNQPTNPLYEHKLSESVIGCHSPVHSGSSSDRSDLYTVPLESWQKKTPDRSANATTSRTPITWIWALLSVTIFITVSVCLPQPWWLQNSLSGQSVGLLKHCAFNLQTFEFTCDYYGGKFSIGNVPSNSWKVAVVTYIITAALLGVGALLSVACLILPIRSRHRASLYAGYLQLFAAILLITTLLVFFVGLDTDMVTRVCGQSTIFYPAECEIGWSYALLITSAALCCLLPVLSHYIDHPLCTKTQEEEAPQSPPLLAPV